MPQDSLSSLIDARQHWNDTAFDVVGDAVYDVTVAGTWEDAGHPSGPEGWQGNATINWFAWLRRARQFPWGALIGSVEKKKPYFPIMPGTLRAPATGRLYCFFNDAWGFYGNNSGALAITLTPVAESPASGTKAIILFSDGTGNSSAKLFKTNVWRMYEAVDLGPSAAGKRDQISYYDDGVGTSSFKPLTLLGGAFGWGLQRNVLDIYRYACRNFRDGDDIYAFGFSRGAFTVRVVVALIASEGLVKSASEAELERKSRDAYRAFRAAFLPRRLKPPTRWLRTITARVREAVRKALGRELYNAAHNRRPPIRFVGVWDTVAAYGGPIAEVTRAIDNWVYPLSMPNYQLNERVLCARHALAIDDERDAFHPLLWDEVHEEALVSGGKVAPDRLQQVWFTGMHADVGGGYPDESLSYVSLLWMIEEAKRADLRTLDVITDRIKALASSYGPIHDSRAGLAAYYRYQPRKISAWLDPVDPRTLSLRDPAIADARHVPHGLLRSVKVHESVINRIANGTDRYAPITLPQDVAIVPPQVEGENAPQADSQTPGPAADTHTPKPMVSRALRARMIDPGAAHARADATEPIWDLVWWRRLVYFATVSATILLILLPLFVARLPAPPFLADGRTWIGGIIRLLTVFLPALAGDWVEVYADNPFYFLLLTGVIALLLRLGTRLERALRDRARGVWRRATQGSPLPAPPPTRVQILRSSRRYQRFVQLFKWYILPDWVFTPLILALSMWLGLAAFTQASLPFLENGTTLCVPSTDSRAIEVVTRDFRTRDVCSESFGSVKDGMRYIVTFDIVDPWYDASVPTSPAGLHAADLPWGVGYLFKPFLRVIDAHYLQPLFEIKPTENHSIVGANTQIYPLAVSAVGDSPTTYRAEFVAKRTGELYLFVNDAMLPFTKAPYGHYNYRYFYEYSGFDKAAQGNRGTARVTVRRADVRDTAAPFPATKAIATR